jgi:futalosine hydrolase
VALLLCAPTADELAALLADADPDGARPDEELKLVPIRLKGRRAWACLTGVGPINAALALGAAIAGAGAAGEPVSGVLLAGLAGAFDLRELPLGSLCLVREEIWPEYGLHDGTGVTAAAFSFPLWRRPAREGGDVYDRLSLARPRDMGLSAAADALEERTSLTVAGVSASRARAAAMRERYGAALENMEGFAVAYACARYGIPCVEARSVSNKVGPRAADEKDFPGALRRLSRVLPMLGLS